jgi:glycerol-3-phosphate acyltransferase PlsY
MGDIQLVSPAALLGLFAIAAIGYLLGSIPFGLVLTRATGAGDLRRIGSGNIGATNVLRTGRKGLAAATLLLDALKGAAAVWAGMALSGGDAESAGALIGGAMAFVGHCYPVWLGFRGGKGVATFGGVALGLWWPLGLVYLGVWLGVLLASRISSVGGFAAALAAPLAAWGWGRPGAALLFAGFALLVFWRHRDNIRRLIAGTEPRIGRGNG